jgi:hypothetical protein
LLAVVVGLAAVLLTGCLAGNYQYVKSSSDRTYFKVPKEWKLFDENALLAGAKRELSNEEFDALKTSRWMVAFDGSPTPALRHVQNLARAHPTGQAWVRQLSSDESDTISTQSLRNIAVDVDQALQQNAAQMTQYEPVNRDGGFRGIRMTVRFALESGSVTMNQVALLNAAATKVYVLIVACSSTCYQTYRGQIEDVMDSWTVRK